MQDTPSQDQFFASLDTTEGRDEVIWSGIAYNSKGLKMPDPNSQESSPDASYGVDVEKGDLRRMANVAFEQFIDANPRQLAQMRSLKLPEKKQLINMMLKQSSDQLNPLKLTKSLLNQPEQLKLFRLAQYFYKTKQSETAIQAVRSLTLSGSVDEEAKAYTEGLSSGSLNVETVLGKKFPDGTGKYLIALTAKDKDDGHAVAIHIDESKGVFKLFDPNGGEFSFKTQDALRDRVLPLIRTAARNNRLVVSHFTSFKPVANNQVDDVVIVPAAGY